MAKLGDMQDPYCVVQLGGKWSATTHVKDGGGGDVVWEGTWCPLSNTPSNTPSNIPSNTPISITPVSIAPLTQLLSCPLAHRNHPIMHPLIYASQRPSHTPAHAPSDIPPHTPSHPHLLTHIL